MPACPRILAIAGSDSGGGAGIQADIKTITMLGGHAMTAITAVTAQNTIGVQAVHQVPTEFVIGQVESVIDDIGVDAVKIGMIGGASTAFAIAEYLAKLEVPIVFDPVMVATSGSALADDQTIEAFTALMAKALVVTPNLPELEALGGKEAVLAHGCHLMVKGGHGAGDMVEDHLYSPAGLLRKHEAPRIVTDDNHGTGCTVSTALAFFLGAGLGLEDAFDRAIAFTRRAIEHAPGLGAGAGPLGQQFVTDCRISEK